MMTHCAFFNPDAPERILSATRSTVILFAYWHDDPANEGECVLRISRDMYFDCMNEWLNQKSCHEIGVDGSIMFTTLRKRDDGMTVPAHLVEPIPDGVKYGTPEYAAFADRQIPITSFSSTCCTEFEVNMHTDDMDEEDAEDDAPAAKPETDEPAPVSFFRPVTVGAEPIAP